MPVSLSRRFATTSGTASERWAWFSARRSCRRAMCWAKRRRWTGTRPGPISRRADPHTGVRDAVDGERGGFPPGLPARDAAGVPGGARARVRLFRRGVPAACATTTWPARCVRSCGAHRREETVRFVAFRSHWRFTAEVCTPGEGHEKGGVEGEGGYFRRNHLVPVPAVADLDALNAFLLTGCRADEARIWTDARTRSGWRWWPSEITFWAVCRRASTWRT